MWLTVRNKNDIHRIALPAGKSILDALRSSGIYIPAVCGGRGTCGKCAVRLLEGDIAASAADTNFFSQSEISGGLRLACTAFPGGDITVEILSDDERHFQTVTSYKTLPTLQYETKCHEEYGIAVDIGTTTVAMELFDMADGKTVRACSFINRQREYGADVISRIKSAGEGYADTLKNLICSGIREELEQLVEGIPANKVPIMAVTGNTTMLHLLLGADCKSLGVYPFTPAYTGMLEYSFNEIFGAGLTGCRLFILPSIGAYVGADVVSGLYMCGAPYNEKPFLLVDLGTNGEMAVSAGGKVWTASTAAGPAFEGGNISQGVGSINGAVCKAVYTGSAFDIKTIGGDRPIGICGSAVIDITSELLVNGLIDETGLLDENFGDRKILVSKDGGIYFTQQDVREIQLAKAAIRAGIECLLDECGLGCGDIDRVYLAGGFGYHLNIKNAAQIGLLPEGLSGVTEPIGNSALGGAKLFLLENGIERLMEIVDRSVELSLSGNKRFSDIYIDNISFP